MSKTVPLEYDIFARDRSGPGFNSLSRNLRDSARDTGLLTSATKSLIGVAAGYVAFDQAAQFIRGSIDEARDAAKVSAQTEAVIKATGGSAKVTAVEIGDLAEKISLKAGVDDEAIQTGSNLLLTFKNVRNEIGEGNKVFNRATVAAVDLSAAGFGSIESSSKMLGKALNDPLLGLTALGRAGVTFTEQQEEQIKALVETGDLLNAQKMILKEVESQVGGSAEAQADSLDKLTVAWGNIKEEVGTALLPYLYDFSDYVVQHGVPAGERFASWLTDEGIPAVKGFADEVSPLAQSILPALAAVLDTTAGAAVALAPAVKSIVDAFNSLPPEVQKAIILGGGAMMLGSRIGLGMPLFMPLGDPQGGKPGADSKPGNAGASKTGASLLGRAAPWLAPFAATGAAPWLASAIAGGAILAPTLEGNVNGMIDGQAARSRALTGRGTYGDSKMSDSIKEERDLRRQVNQLQLDSIAGIEGASEKYAEMKAQLDELHAQMYAPTVDLRGAAEVLDWNDQIQAALFLLGETHPAPSVTMPGSGTVIAQAGTILATLDQIQPFKTIITSVIGADSAISKLQQVRAAFDSVPGLKLIRTAAVNAPGLFADGGPIVGPGGPRSDLIPIMASNGENMWSAADVHAAGGQGGVERLKKAVRGNRLADGGPIGVDTGRPGRGFSEDALARAVNRGLRGTTMRVEGQRNLRATIEAGV